MHGIAKRGLALVAATSGLVLGTAAFAAADSASATADTGRSGGAVAGWAVQAPVNVPVKLCGVSVQDGTIREMSKGATCTTGATGVVAQADPDRSGGVVQAAAHAPVLFCGWDVNAVAVKNHYEGSTCTDDIDGPGSSATATAEHSRGIASGDIVPAGANLPVDFCGANVTAATVHSVHEGSTCSD
jgi:hypothetical protein